jgi:hypothetical protein
MSEASTDDFILHNMPYFIAVNYQRLLATQTSRERVELIIHIYHLGIRALTIGLVSQYLIRDRDNVSDPYLNELLQHQFPHMTLDVWNLLLFATLKAYEGKRGLFFIPELYDFYWDSTTMPHRRRSEVEQPFDRLTQIAAELHLADFMPRNQAGWERLAVEAFSLLRQVLDSLSFFGTYDLIRIIRGDAQSYDFELHKGTRIVRGQRAVPPRAELRPGWFYLRKEAEDFLRLHPLIVFWEQQPVTGDLVQGDTGIYDHFVPDYERLRYLLDTLGKVSVEDVKNTQTFAVDEHTVQAFITLIYDTIEEIKRKRQQTDRLTWWQLRDICLDITQKRMASVRKKYRRELYLQRDKTRQAFEHFLSSEKRCFVLIGKSGVGKSNFFLALDEQLLRPRSDVCVLMYDGAYLRVSSSITDVISQDFADRLILSGRQIQHIWREIALIDGIEGRQVILFVDAINENSQAKELLRQLDELAQTPWAWLKVVFSSRPETWQMVKRGVTLAEAEYYREEGETLGVMLEPFSYSEQMEQFSTQELPSVYALYQRAFDLRTSYSDLPHTLRELLRDPLSLLLVAKTYEGKPIPAALKVTTLIGDYVKELQDNGRLRDEDLWLLENRLVPLMAREGHYSNAITRTDLDQAGEGLYEAVYSEQVLSDGRRLNQPFTNLVDADILVRQEEGRTRKIAFKYERFYEYFVGNRILELSKSAQAKADRNAFFLQMVSETATTPFLWGAVKNALIQEAHEHGIEAIKNLCFTDQQRVKEVMVSVLTDLGRDYRAKVEALLREMIPPEEQIGGIQRLRQLFGGSDVLLDTPLRVAGEIAVEVACNCQMPAILQTAAIQPEAGIRAAAIRQIYYLWQQDRELGFTILSFLASKVSSGLIPVFTALESVFGLSLLIFFEYYQDKTVTTRLQLIWRDVINSVLNIRQSGGLLGNMFRDFVRDRIFGVLMTLIFRWLQGFPTNNIVNYHDLQAFFNLGPEEKMLYRSLIQYMDARGDYSREQMERDWMAVLRTNNLLMEGVTLMGFVAHAIHHRPDFLPFLETFFVAAQKNPQPNLYLSVVPLVLTTMLDYDPKDDQAFALLVESAASCQEYYTRTPQVPGMYYTFQAPESMELAPYIIHEYERTHNIRTEWLETRIQKALADGNIPFFKTFLEQELHIVGIELQKPAPALNTLALFFNTNNQEIRALIQNFLAHLRLHYPDEVDDFLQEQNAPEDFQLRVRTMAASESIGALIGMRAWVFLRDVVIHSDTIRPRIMRIFAQAADCKDVHVWVDYFLRDIVNMVYGGEVLRQAK